MILTNVSSDGSGSSRYHSSTFYGFGSRPEEYDRIITGDLGTVGQEILFDLLKKKGYDIENNHSDCGIEIFDAKEQDTDAGGSGCGCSASVLSAYYLPKIISGEWKRCYLCQPEHCFPQ